MYGFFVRRSMGYGISGVMGYELQFPANQLGNGKILWGIRDYGLSELWVKRASYGNRLGRADFNTTPLIGNSAECYVALRTPNQIVM